MSDVRASPDADNRNPNYALTKSSSSSTNHHPHHPQQQQQQQQVQAPTSLGHKKAASSYSSLSSIMSDQSSSSPTNQSFSLHSILNNHHRRPSSMDHPTSTSSTSTSGEPIISPPSDSLRKDLLKSLSSFLRGGHKSSSTNSQFNKSNGDKSSKMSSSIVVSSSGLILHDRPLGLPAKNPEEKKKHMEQYNKILEAEKNRLDNLLREQELSHNRRLEQEDRQHKLTQLWKSDLLPHWSLIKDRRRLRELFWEGLPSTVRGQVWQLSIGNHLNLTNEDFSEFLEQLRAKVALQDSISSSPSPIVVAAAAVAAASTTTNTNAADIIMATSRAINDNYSSSIMLEDDNFCTCLSNEYFHNKEEEEKESKENDTETEESDHGLELKVESSSSLSSPPPPPPNESNGHVDVELRHHEDHHRRRRHRPPPQVNTLCSICGLRQLSDEDDLNSLNDDDDEIEDGERRITTTILSGYRCSGTISNLRLIRLDIPRTFPNLSLFQDGGPLNNALFELLGAFVCYRPDIGYVQGMSFIAAILLLVMDLPMAFICFANILHQPCLNAFYSLEESAFQSYFDYFDSLLKQHLPKLHQHFHYRRMELKMFLIEWIVTIFSKTLPLDLSLRVWDLYSIDGEASLFRTALGILRLFEDDLTNGSFESIATLLTNPLPMDSLLLNNPDHFMSSIRSIPPVDWPPTFVGCSPFFPSPMGSLATDLSCGGGVGAAGGAAGGGGGGGSVENSHLQPQQVPHHHHHHHHPQTPSSAID